MSNLPTFKLERPNLPKNSVEDETFRVFCRKGEDSTIHLQITESIGDNGWGEGIRASEVSATLRQTPDAPVDAEINSGGGLAFDGIAIFNALVGHNGPVTTTVTGLAYSAASVVAMAGDRRKIYESAEFGIHRAHGVAIGNTNQMLAVAEFLDKLDSQLINLYSAGTNQSVEQVTQWLDGDSLGEFGTMFNGEEAVSAGFADEMIPNPVRNQKPMEAAAAKERKHLLPLALQARRAMIETIKNSG